MGTGTLVTAATYFRCNLFGNHLPSLKRWTQCNEVTVIRYSASNFEAATDSDPLGQAQLGC